MYFLSLTPNMSNTLDIHYPTDLVKSEDKTLKLSSFNKLQYCKPDPKVIFVSGAGVTKSVERGKKIICEE